MALTLGLGGVDGAEGAVCSSVKTVSRARMSAKLSGMLKREKEIMTTLTI